MEEIIEETEKRLDVFYRETGIWPPGRSMPRAMCGGEGEYQIRCRAYELWMKYEQLQAELAQASGRHDASCHDLLGNIDRLEKQRAKQKLAFEKIKDITGTLRAADLWPRQRNQVKELYEIAEQALKGEK